MFVTWVIFISDKKFVSKRPCAVLNFFVISRITFSIRKSDVKYHDLLIGGSKYLEIMVLRLNMIGIKIVICKFRIFLGKFFECYGVFSQMILESRCF